MKHTTIIAILFIFSFLNASAQKPKVFTAGGKAIKGYDPVAFFKQSMAIKGIDSLSYQWEDATWLFASKENLDAFKSAPEQYAPQYGGYCAYGTAEGHKASTQADTWTILDDKLYFNYNSKVKEAWIKDQRNLIIKADQQWPAVKTQ